MADKQETREENLCTYCLFPQHLVCVDGNVSAEKLNETRLSYLAEISSLLMKYIWQKDTFRLSSRTDESPSQNNKTGGHPGCLWGATNYGDNVDDEWFIVYLLFKLTNTFPGLVAQISDSDGEFLLIEAADVLPKWLNPESSQNRVFIFNGSVHIVPVEVMSAVPSITDALNCIRNSSVSTLAPANLQDLIYRRISDYPEKIDKNLHRAHCYVPAALALVLKQAPHLLAPAVEAFYYRDPIDLKACTIMTHFRPGTRVMTEVVFTKCLYAQLMQQNFKPRGDWSIPSQKSPKYKAYVLGMKLAHGFEILCSRHKTVSDSGKSSSTFDEAKWSKFLQCLKDRGYFKSEIEGSKHYSELCNQAKHFYEQVIQRPDDGPGYHGAEILNVLQRGTVDIEELRKQEQFLKPADDDSWLEVSPETFDSMLAKAAGRKDIMDMAAIAQSVNSFVNKESDFEGAEIQDQGGNEIQFDSGGFIQSMEKIFHQDDSLTDSDSDMSEYGSDRSEDDYGLGTPKKSNKVQPPKVNKVSDYMAMMDRELAKTEVGKTFDTTKPTPPPRPKKMQKKLKEREQASKSQRESSDMSDIDAVDDDFAPVSVDMMAVDNLLKSYTAQYGLPGPSSNLLGSLSKQPGSN